MRRMQTLQAAEVANFDSQIDRRNMFLGSGAFDRARHLPSHLLPHLVSAHNLQSSVPASLDEGLGIPLSILQSPCHPFHCDIRKY